ncbi:MAG: glycosyltransferase N-terminal domain-containing protein [Capnocytophaga sp.]|nr:glycosyltransferase N-terminal domain-containing protein [Capnocytophaga sp.]
MYSFIIYLVSLFLPILGLFNKKIKLFVKGRKQTIPILKEKIKNTDKVIWIHVASLGEFEQGLPIIKKLKHFFPEKKIVVSFFSPSGYEVRKNSPDADAVVYLPLDIPNKVKDFLNHTHPEMAIFIKYEFWKNYLSELHQRKIPTYLVSGIFRENQWFFKEYSFGMKKILSYFTHFFVQNEHSANLLHSIGLKNVTISGDTRFDRVLEILKRDNSLLFIEKFKNNSLCVVFGSSWEEDEAIYLPYLNANPDLKYIIAPHNIHPEKIKILQEKIKLKTLLFSEKENKDLSNYQVLIIDTIGILTKIYSYADIAYVGGGMATGLHNILEPAVFGIPVVIGKNYGKFLEAKDLVSEKSVFSIFNIDEFSKILNYLKNNSNKRKELGQKNYNYIIKKSGATNIFMNFIKDTK